MNITIENLNLLLNHIEKELELNDTIIGNSMIVNGLDSKEVEFTCLKLYEMDMIDCKLEHSIKHSVPQMTITAITPYGKQLIKNKDG